MSDEKEDEPLPTPPKPEVREVPKTITLVPYAFTANIPVNSQIMGIMILYNSHELGIGLVTLPFGYSGPDTQKMVVELVKAPMATADKTGAVKSLDGTGTGTGAGPDDKLKGN